jgi:hypothetical protein
MDARPVGLVFWVVLQPPFLTSINLPFQTAALGMQAASAASRSCLGLFFVQVSFTYLHVRRDGMPGTGLAGDRAMLHSDHTATSCFFSSLVISDEGHAANPTLGGTPSCM